MLYYEDIELNQPKLSREYLMTKEEIMSFAGQWDPQPFHIDEVAAAQWPLGLTASSLHTIAVSTKLSNETAGEECAVVAGLGWDEIRMHLPVRPDDRLHTKIWLDSKRESASKPDMGIITSCIHVINHNDELVMSYKISSMIMKRPEE